MGRRSEANLLSLLSSDNRLMDFVAAGILDSLRERGLLQMRLTPEMEERLWLMFVKRATTHERRFKAATVRLFREQEREVLDNMKSVKDIIDEWSFDTVAWTLRFAEMGQLLLPESVEETGQAELTALVDVDFDVTNPRVSEFVRARSFKFAGDVNNTTIESIRRELLAGLADGEAIPKLRKRIEAVFDDCSRRRAQMIARSEVIRASNFGAEEAYKQSRVVRGKGWLTAMDERACPWCEDMNGKEMGLGQSFFKLGDSLTVDEQTFNFTYEDIDYPPLHPQCYAKDTEIYTKDGWTSIQDVCIGDKVLTLVPETKDLEWAAVINTVCSQAEEIFHMTNAQKSFSLKVTRDHPFFGYKRVDRGNNGRIPEPFLAQGIRGLGRVNSEFRFYTSSEWVGADTDTVNINGIEFKTNQFCKFMGYYLAEGSTGQRKTGRYQISIAQSTHLMEMWDDLRCLPVNKVWLGKDKIYISDNRLGSYLAQFGKCYEKYIPEAIKELSSGRIRTFLDAFLLGDGCIKKSKKWKGGNFEDTKSYATASKRMAGDLGELIIKTGKSVSYSLMALKGKEQKFGTRTYTINHDVWRVNDLTSQYKMFTNIGIERKPYKDSVYDIEVGRNHTILVRTEGKVVWGSNCRCTLVPLI